MLNVWLHTATRNAALNLMISEQRRQAREVAAHSLAPADTTSDGQLDWDQLRPVLDAAIDELPETDRSAVVLRFLERQSFAKIGATLLVSEDAARMRTERALEKLRAALSRRGITSTAAALGALVASQPLVSAPASLSATFSTHAIALAGAGLTATTVTTLMSLKLIATTATITGLFAFGAGAYFGISREFDAPPPPPMEAPRHSQMIASLRQENLSLRTEMARPNSQVAAHRTVAAPVAKPAALAPSVSSESLARSSRTQAMFNNLRQLSVAIDQFSLENGRPPASLDEIVGERKYIRRLTPIDGENYALNALLAGGALTVTDSEGNVVTYDPRAPKPPQTPRTAEQTRVDELARRLQLPLQRAVEAYRMANQGKNPANEQALIPHFATPQEGADWVELLEAQKAGSLHR